MVSTRRLPISLEGGVLKNLLASCVSGLTILCNLYSASSILLVSSPSSSSFFATLTLFGVLCCTLLVLPEMHKCHQYTVRQITKLKFFITSKKGIIRKSLRFFAFITNQLPTRGTILKKQLLFVIDNQQFVEYWNRDRHSYL